MRSAWSRRDGVPLSRATCHTTATLPPGLKMRESSALAASRSTQCNALATTTRSKLSSASVVSSADPTLPPTRPRARGRPPAAPVPAVGAPGESGALVRGRGVFRGPVDALEAAVVAEQPFGGPAHLSVRLDPEHRGAAAPGQHGERPP